MTSNFFTAKIGNQELFSVEASKVPSVNRVGFLLSGGQNDLVFINSKKGEQIFDLSSVSSEGFNWVDLCVQISKDFITLADCRLGHDGETPDDPENIMFQPIPLPECNIAIETKGRSLHYRGFFSWWSGSHHLSLLGICDYCQKSFRLSIQNMGNSPELYYYCEQGIHTLLAKPNREYSFKDKSTHLELESKLPSCNKCGTKFARNNSFRCVHCGKPYIDLETFPDDAKERYALALYDDEYQHFDYYRQT